MKHSASKGIRARAPLRLGFAGGGTDLSPFCDQHGGLVMNATLSLYAYAHLSPSPDQALLFEASEIGERYTCPLTPQVPLGRRALLHRGVYNRMVRDFNGGEPIPVHVRTTVDVPSGSGLGGSSTLVVALLEAYRAYLRVSLSDYELARLAFDIERNDLGLAGGRQDQYAAAFGGFNFMEFNPNDQVVVNQLRINASAVRELEASMILYYTGQSRSSAKIIAQQQEGLHKAESRSLDSMFALKQEAVEMKDALLRGDVIKAAEVLRRGWEAKKASAAAVSNSEIERILGLAIELGAYSGKVSGAGGGGFVMIIADPERRIDVINRLRQEPGLLLPCVFSDAGAQSWSRRL
jgi:D-glycero-alpha-D-manno-heptose-7-phosphate kinase